MAEGSKGSDKKSLNAIIWGRFQKKISSKHYIRKKYIFAPLLNGTLANMPL